jgi:hypothetical protein
MHAILTANRQRIIQSFNAHPVSNLDGTYEAIAIKWKLAADGSTETMFIAPYVRKAWSTRPKPLVPLQAQPIKANLTKFGCRATIISIRCRAS